MAKRAITLDSVATLLAARAGEAWLRLPDYPGFSRGRWRDLARSLIAEAAPAARLIEGRILWDGSMSDDIVIDLSIADAFRLVESWRPTGR